MRALRLPYLVCVFGAALPTFLMNSVERERGRPRKRPRLVNDKGKAKGEETPVCGLR